MLRVHSLHCLVRDPSPDLGLELSLGFDLFVVESLLNGLVLGVAFQFEH